MVASRIIFATAISFCFLSKALALEPVQMPPPQAPPTPPPIQTQTAVPRWSPPPPPSGETLYSIGAPTDEEQYYVELINRARANPSAEGILLATTTDPEVMNAINYFSVNLVKLQEEFNTLPAVPPLAINAALTAAARSHSDWMFTNAVQEHIGTGGSSPGNRLTAAGYNWDTYGENIFSYASSVFHGHAGFEIDWGYGTYGMQGPPRGHRENIHYSSFREVGVGVRNGMNTVITNGVTNTVGPQLVTQDFATALSSQPFVTGVVYYDLNTNNFYDPGEGVGGITVQVAGSSYYAVTANSGGYSVPVPNVNTTRTVTFSGLNLDFSTNAAITNLANVKVDFVAAYSSPALVGPAAILVGVPVHYTFDAVGGATAYEWQYIEKKIAEPEPCENLLKVQANISSGYSVVDTSIKDAGASSFHLAHPNFEMQTMTLAKTYYPNAGSSLQFRSRLGWATTTQIARVQVALEDTNNWVDIYTQSGTGTAGETSFNTRNVPLAAYAGKFIKIRFAYTATVSAYSQTTAGVGWYIDSIAFSNTSELGTRVSTGIGSATSFDFSPMLAGNFLLSVRPFISGRFWALGSIKEVIAQNSMTYGDWVTNLYPTVTGNPSGDHDHDGLSNFVEYAFGFNPDSTTSVTSLPHPTISGTLWQVSYTEPTGISGIIYGAQWSTNLVNWTDITDSGSGKNHTFIFDVGAASRMFFRHRLRLTP